MRLSKGGDCVVIGVLVRSQIPESHIFESCTFNLARTHHAPAITVQQYPHHHHWMVGSHPSPILAPVVPKDFRKIQFIGYISDKTRQMIVRKPFLQRWWEENNLIQVAGAESLAHTTRIAMIKHLLQLMFYQSWVPAIIYLRQTPSTSRSVFFQQLVKWKTTKRYENGH